MLARQQAFQSEIRELHAPQRARRMPDEFKHSPHLPVAPFAQRQLDQRVAFGLRSNARAARRGFAVFEIDSGFQLLQCRDRNLASNARPIDFFNSMRRMRQKLRQRAVIGQKQNARCIEIKASDGVQMPIFFGQQMRDRGAPFRVFARRYNTGGLVHQQNRGGAGRDAQRLPVDIDAINRDVGARAQLGHDVPVDQNAALRNQFFRRPTARNTAARDQFLQSLAAARVARVLMPRALARFRLVQIVLIRIFGLKRIIRVCIRSEAAFFHRAIISRFVQKSLGIAVDRNGTLDRFFRRLKRICLLSRRAVFSLFRRGSHWPSLFRQGLQLRSSR